MRHRNVTPGITPSNMDYSKWDVIEDDDDLDVHGNEHSSSTSDKLGALKLEADNLFKIALESCDPYDYKFALYQGYMVLLFELNTLKNNNETDDRLKQFEISCKLNCACCHLKLMDLNETIRLCSEILTKHCSLLTRDQILRARYFRSYAYYKLDSIETFLSAESDAAAMTDILSSGFTDRDENVADYIVHFESLKEKRDYLNGIDERIKLESECHNFVLINNSNTKEGWSLYVQKEYKLSSEWFKEELQKVLREGTDILLSKNSLLCNLYRGLGKSEAALHRHSEAAKAFSAAAGYTNLITEVGNLHLQAATLFYKASQYDASIMSYKTALQLVSDRGDAEELTSANCRAGIFIATVNAGLGRCYLKIGELEKAVNYLKAGAGYLTDNIFIKPLKPLKKNPFKTNIKMETVIDTTTQEIAMPEDRILNFAVVSVEATHLLNALESLSDAYAAQREWENAIYTANCTLGVCREFLSALGEEVKGNIISSVKFADTQVITIDGIEKNSSSSSSSSSNIGNGTGKCSISSNSNDDSGSSSNTNGTIYRMKNNILSSLKGRMDQDTEILKAKREQFYLSLCKRRAFTLLAMGHMVKKILYHDINRDSGQDFVIGSTYMFSTIDCDLGNENFNLTGKNIEGPDDITTATAVNRINTLWTDAAAEFSLLGDSSQAFTVNKDIATLWSSLAKVQAYSTSLILVDSEDHQVPSDEIKTFTDARIESSPQDNSSPHVITQFSSSMIPLNADSAENILRIDAARKAAASWKRAADAAGDQCKVAEAKDINKDSSEVNSSSTDLLAFDSITAELRLAGWQLVMRCLYNAGLCAMLYEMTEAEHLFERAQELKVNYHAISGLLAEVEKEEKRVHTSIRLEGDTVRGDSDAALVQNSLQLRKKENWLSYNTLCCDISYHLGYTYVRSERIAFAIAEAEMAIGFSAYSSESKMRRRRCLGLLSMGLSASGQVTESMKAFKEIRILSKDTEVDAEYEISQLQLFIEYWKRRRTRKHVVVDRTMKSLPIVDGGNSLKANELAVDGTDMTEYRRNMRLLLNAIISLIVLIGAIIIANQ